MEECTRGLQTEMREKLGATQEDIKEEIREDITLVAKKKKKTNLRIDALENKLQKAFHKQALRFETMHKEL